MCICIRSSPQSTKSSWANGIQSDKADSIRTKRCLGNCMMLPQCFYDFCNFFFFSCSVRLSNDYWGDSTYRRCSDKKWIHYCCYWINHQSHVSIILRSSIRKMVLCYWFFQLKQVDNFSSWTKVNESLKSNFHSVCNDWMMMNPRTVYKVTLKGWFNGLFITFFPLLL